MKIRIERKNFGHEFKQEATYANNTSKPNEIALYVCNKEHNLFSLFTKNILSRDVYLPAGKKLVLNIYNEAESSNLRTFITTLLERSSHQVDLTVYIHDDVKQYADDLYDELLLWTVEHKKQLQIDGTIDDSNYQGINFTIK